VDAGLEHKLGIKKSRSGEYYDITAMINGSEDRLKTELILDRSKDFSKIDVSVLKAYKEARRKQTQTGSFAPKEGSSEVVFEEIKPIKLIPNSSSISLIFNKASSIQQQEDLFYHRWISVLGGISKMMSARICELVIFCKESRNLLMEMSQK